MIKSIVTKFVGDLHHNVGKACVTDPVRDVCHPGAHGLLVFEPLVLSLVIAAQDNDRAGAIARLNCATHAFEIGLLQRAVGGERCVYRAFIAR